MLSNWQSVLKIKTNVDTKENHCNFIVTNEVWVAAGGRPDPRYDRNTDEYETQEGYRFMDIEDIEESIGRKLTPRDFLPSAINAFTKNKTAIDRMGKNHENFGILSLLAPDPNRSFCGISDINAHKYFIEHFPNSRVIDNIKEQLEQLEGE